MKTPRLILAAGLFAGLLVSSANAQYYGPAPAGNAQKQGGSDEQRHPTGYFEFSIGLAAPVGAFGATTGTAYGGYAETGSTFNISLAIPVNHSNIGVALMYGDYSNWFNINGYVNTLQIADQSKTYAPLVQDVYRESFILGGIFWTWPMDRLSFDARLMGGLAFSSLPEINYGANWDPAYGQYDYWWDTPASSSVGFGFDMGVDLRYKLRRTSIMFGMDYIYGGATVNAYQRYDSPTTTTYTRIYGGVPITEISFNLGLAYEIK